MVLMIFTSLFVSFFTMKKQRDSLNSGWGATVKYFKSWDLIVKFSWNFNKSNNYSALNEIQNQILP